MLGRIAIVALMTVFGATAQGALINGDFEADLNGWSDLGFVPVAVINGEVRVSTDDFAGSAFGDLGGSVGQGVALDQFGFLFVDNGIGLDANVAELVFDVTRTTTTNVLEGSGSFLRDFLQVTVLDELDPLMDLIFTDDDDPLFGDFASGPGKTEVRLDIASLASRSVGLLFDVFDFDDGMEANFFIDNVRFVNAVVPTPASEPAVGFIALLGALILVRLRSVARSR